MMIPIEAAATVALVFYLIGVWRGAHGAYVSECHVMDKGEEG